MFPQLILTVLIITKATFILCQDPITVTIETGQLLGAIHQSSDGDYTAFRGIPYAKPPIGNLRFRPPELPESWPNIRNATEVPPICPQPVNVTASPVVTAVSEDCLYLDVWIAGNLSGISDNLLPVMVSIHGGGFAQGGAALFPGNALVTMGDPIVLVVMQYRLGLLGFSSSGGDGRVPAMLGMKDQVVALEWVQRNIAEFGGDRDQVTIFGESAGAWAVVMHMVSSMSAGLFHRAIVQSAPNMWRVASEKTYEDNIEGVAQGLGCGDEEDVMVCLRNVPWQQIVVSFPNNIIITVDGEFLTESIDATFQHGRINDADLILGFNNDDGDLVYQFLFASSVDLSIPYDRPLYDSVFYISLLSWLSSTMETNPSNSAGISPAPTAADIKRYGHTLNPETIQQFIQLLHGKYASTGNTVMNTRGLLDCLRDSLFIAYGYLVATSAQAQGSRVWIYSFETRSAQLPQPGPDDVPLFAPHAGELEFLFDYDPFLDRPSVFNAEERALATSMKKAWTSFAANGSPTFLTMGGAEVAWPESTTQQPRHLVFDTNMADNGSVNDLSMPWQSVAEFWLALDNLADFEENSSEDSSSEEDFESSVLKLNSFQADLAVLLLSFVCFLLLVASCGLFCSLCRRRKGVIS